MFMRRYKSPRGARLVGPLDKFPVCRSSLLLAFLRLITLNSHNLGATLKRFLLLQLFVVSICWAQGEVVTVPVGFNTATVPAAASNTSPSSTVISVPFYATAAFESLISSVDSSNQISVSGAAFTTNQWVPASPAETYLARLKSGMSVGRFFLITSNTATQLTLDTVTAGYTLVTSSPTTSQIQVNVGDQVEILPANTLASLFGSTAATVPFLQAASAGAADNIYLFNGIAFDVYFFNGTSWRKSGSLANQNNTVILPDRGVFIVRRGTTPLNLTFLGTVPSTTEQTDITGPGSTFRSNRFPVDFTLAGTNPLNLQLLPNWLGGASASAADDVYLWNGTGWSVYFYNNSTGHWRKSGSLNDQDTQPVPSGAAMFIVRQSTAQGSTSTLVQLLPYPLN